MDAFFVSVYLLGHPEDVGQAVAVGGSPDGRGVITSASYEARQFGVRSAMPARRALRLCPHLKIVRSDWRRIRDCSKLVRFILSQHGPMEPMSVDEAYVDLTGRRDPERLAADIQRQVKADTHLPASVGLATSKLVAKVASDHGKPEGCVIVPPGTESDFLAPMPVRVILGIGPRTAERLAEIGIETCGQLADADPERLAGSFGRHGRRLPERARGIDRRSVNPKRGPARSISGERTFGKDIDDRNELHEQLRKLSARVGRSLRRRELVARTVFVKFRWSDFTTFTRRHTLEAPIDGDDEIFEQAAALWDEHWPSGQRVRLMGVGVANLLSNREARQMFLEL
jgi:DNA polymerase-4